jgi:hypothetical protein
VAEDDGTGDPTTVVKELGVEVDREVDDALRLWVVCLVRVIRVFLEKCKKVSSEETEKNGHSLCRKSSCIASPEPFDKLTSELGARDWHCGRSLSKYREDNNRRHGLVLCSDSWQGCMTLMWSAPELNAVRSKTCTAWSVNIRIQ